MPQAWQNTTADQDLIRAGNLVPTLVDRIERLNARRCTCVHNSAARTPGPWVWVDLASASAPPEGTPDPRKGGVRNVRSFFEQGRPPSSQSSSHTTTSSTISTDVGARSPPIEIDFVPAPSC